MITNVINRPTSVVVELSAIAKIHNYKGLHKGHYFISMAWKCTMHSGVIWIISLRIVFVFSMIDNQRVIYLNLFAFSFLSNMLILFLNIL